jgi:uncharacterized protein YkwD
MKAVAICIVAIAMTGTAMACTAPKGASEIEAGIASWVNAERAKQGLPKLSVNGRLNAAATSHACDMAKKGELAHKTKGGKNFGPRLKSAGYSASKAVENIARSPQIGAETAHRIWMKSPAHRDNVLAGGIREMGIGVATDGKDVYYVYIGGSS